MGDQSEPRFSVDANLSTPPMSAAAPSQCLNCGATLGGAYCSACGQPRVDLVAPTWDVVREAFSDATDVDGRVVRTLRGIASPGSLTLDFLRGRRAPYVGPLKLFLIAGAVLSTTWALTRGVDARYYGYALDESAATYIEKVVRGLLAASAVLAITSWLLWRGRRRLIDETVFSVHLVAAVSLWMTVVLWIGTAWKLAWGSSDGVPSGVPSLVNLVFVPAAILTLLYVAVAVRRVYGLVWWAAAARTIVFGIVGAAAITATILSGN
jgi:hypothetical protein